MFKYARLALFSISLLVLCAFYPDSSPAVPSAPGDQSDKATTVTKMIASKPVVVKKTVSGKSAEDKAVDLVWAQSDVKAWKKNFKGEGGASKLGGHAVATADPDNDANKGDNKDNYVVHVYESLPDHTATFNWYSVNVKTRRVQRQF